MNPHVPNNTSLAHTVRYDAFGIRVVDRSNGTEVCVSVHRSRNGYTSNSSCASRWVSN